MNVAAFVFAVLGAVLDLIELFIYAGLASFAHGSSGFSDHLTILIALVAFSLPYFTAHVLSRERS